MYLHSLSWNPPQTDIFLPSPPKTPRPLPARTASPLSKPPHWMPPTSSSHSSRNWQKFTVSSAAKRSIKARPVLDQGRAAPSLWDPPTVPPTRPSPDSAVRGLMSVGCDHARARWFCFEGRVFMQHQCRAGGARSLEQSDDQGRQMR